MRKNFISKNNGFVCQNCGVENPLAVKTCRNHCTECLYSLHVDQDVPGDRGSDCLSLMKPTAIQQNSKKGFYILHKCENCGKEINNKLAEDDNWDTVCSINEF